jgi:hypothetical protein
MIPLCCLDKVEYTDEDGTEWTFKPVTGDLEREYIKMNESINEQKDNSVKLIDELIGKVVLKCRPKDKPDYFKRHKICDSLTINEKLKVIIQVWQKANELSASEKKT